MTIVQTTELDLRARQIALEEESLTLGIDRYKKDRERNDEADTGPGKRLIRDAIAIVAEGNDHVSEAGVRVAHDDVVINNEFGLDHLREVAKHFAA